MANYNTFTLIDCINKKTLLITSSARKVSKLLTTGYRVEVWNNNELIEKIYNKNRLLLNPYIEKEREYIRNKQAKAEARNKKRNEKYYILQK